jgi:hypothetical protein
VFTDTLVINSSNLTSISGGSYNISGSSFSFTESFTIFNNNTYTIVGSNWISSASISTNYDTSPYGTTINLTTNGVITNSYILNGSTLQIFSGPGTNYTYTLSN